MTLTPVNTFGMNWKVDCILHLSSATFQNLVQSLYKTLEAVTAENIILMPMVLECEFILRCPYTFGHTVYVPAKKC